MNGKKIPSKSRELSSSEDSDSDYCNEVNKSNGIIVPESDHEDSNVISSDESKDCIISSDEEESDDRSHHNQDTTGSASGIISDDDENASGHEGNVKSSPMQPVENSTPSISRSAVKRRSMAFKSAVDIDDTGDEFVSFVSSHSHQADSPSPSSHLKKNMSSSLYQSNNFDSPVLSSGPTLKELDVSDVLSPILSNGSPLLGRDESGVHSRLSNRKSGKKKNFINESGTSESSIINSDQDEDRIIENVDSDGSDFNPVNGGNKPVKNEIVDAVIEEASLPLSPSHSSHVVDESMEESLRVDEPQNKTPHTKSPVNNDSFNRSVQDLEECNKVIDLTQSDDDDVSLQNSPRGATMPDDSLHNSPGGARMLEQAENNVRDVGDIVSELAYVTQEVDSKQALLDTLNIKTLPDQGKNLMKKVSDLYMQKDKLEKELSRNNEFVEQKAALKKFEQQKSMASIPKKQATLNFESKLKTEPRSEVFVKQELLDSDYGHELSKNTEESRNYSDDSPESVKGLDSSKMPNWGDLPKPDMTISNFGKQAMQTHITEKTLTMEALATLHKALKNCPSEDTLAEDPRRLKVELMPHQKHGLAWMMWREQEKPPGGILADDMGLGKTLSMISLILKSQELKEDKDSDEDESESEDDSPRWMNTRYSRMPKGGTLIVCPASLMGQWEREICKRVKRKTLSVELYHGNNRETKPRRLAQYDVVITTYGLMSRESGVEGKNATRMKDKGPIHSIRWERIILDEAHMVRNYKSQMCVGVCELEGKHRWCLTGTPIQNKELDLYALLKFLQCSPFDDLTVWKRWVDNKNAAGLQRLNTMMKSLMLRRTKQQLQERGDLNCLPEKNYEIIDIHLDPEELEIYEKVAVFSSALFSEFLSQRAEKQQALDVRYGFSSKPVWERDQSEVPDNQFTTTKELAQMHRKMQGADIKTHQILVLLLRLRQICCHPGLVKKMVESGDLDLDGGEVDESGLDTDLFEKMNNLNINDDELVKEEKKKHAEILSIGNPVLNLDRASAKVRGVLDVLEEKVLESDDKAIVVSQWTSMLNIISKFLEDRNISFVSLNGEIPVNKRQEIVSSFNRVNSGPQVLLLSLTAGGVGLNLVGANHLLLVDIHWNPQLENQACDRIYRVGQKKEVFIYRFITTDTIEEKIKALQEKKLALADSVLTGTMKTNASKLTLDDLKMLFAAPAPAPVPGAQGSQAPHH